MFIYKFYYKIIINSYKHNFNIGGLFTILNNKNELLLKKNKDDTLNNPDLNITSETPISIKATEIVNNITNNFSSAKDNIYNNILRIKENLSSINYFPFEGIKINSHSCIYIGIFVGLFLLVLYIISIISASFIVRDFLKRNLNKEWMVILMIKYKYLSYLIVFLHSSFILLYIYLISYRLFNLLCMLIEFLAKFNINSDSSYKLTIEFIVFLLLFSNSLIWMNIFNKKNEKGYYSKFLIFIALFLLIILLYWIGVLNGYWSTDIHPFIYIFLSGWTLINNIGVCFAYIITNLGISWNSIICKFREPIDLSNIFKGLKPLFKIPVVGKLFKTLLVRASGKCSIVFFYAQSADGSRQYYAAANEADRNSILKNSYISQEYRLDENLNTVVSQDKKPVSWYHGLILKNFQWYRNPMPRAHSLVPPHYRVTNPFFLFTLKDYYNHVLMNDADNIKNHLIYFNEIANKCQREDYELVKYLILDSIYHIVPKDNEKKLILTMNALDINNDLFNSIRLLKYNTQKGDFDRQICIFNPDFSILPHIRNIDFSVFSMDDGNAYEGYFAIRSNKIGAKIDINPASIRKYLYADFTHKRMFSVNDNNDNFNYIDTLRRSNTSNMSEIVKDAYKYYTMDIHSEMDFVKGKLQIYMSKNSQLNKDQVSEYMDELNIVLDVFEKLAKERIHMRIRGIKKEPIDSFDSIKWKYLFSRDSSDMNTSKVVEKLIEKNPDFKSTFSNRPEDIL